MPVDLRDYVENLRGEVNPPGSNLFPSATPEEWLLRLRNGFWNARLQGIDALVGFSEADGVISPVSGTTDLSRDLVQLIVVWAGFNVIRNALRNLRTMVRNQAGPVSQEYQQSANVMRDVMASIKEEKDAILVRLSDLGTVNTYVIDAISARDESILAGVTSWVGASVDPHARGASAGIGLGP